MAQAQLVTGRIVLKYTVAGHLHRAVANVRNPQLVGSVWQINSRTLDANDMVWSDAANGFYESISYLTPAGTTWSAAEFWQKVANAWVLRSTFTLTSTDHSSGTSYPAGQHTLTLRDVQFHQLKVIVLDSSAGDIPKKYLAISAMPTQVQNFAKQFTSAPTVGGAPYIWQVSDSDQYINTSALVGLVTTYNRKIRRAYGLA